MEKLSKITSSVSLSVPAYMQDHCLGNQAVLPAVEALRVLADTVRKHWPRVDVTYMRDIVFSRLLPIGKNNTAVDLFVTACPVSNNTDDIAAALLTRFISKSGTVTRMKEHITTIFCAKPDTSPAPLPDVQPHVNPAGFTIAADRLYRELVPFGPGFQSLAGDIYLSPTLATGTVGTPVSARPADSALGSPFPLDAAFHVACAWGQRYTRTVAYPVAIRKRTIFKPTLQGDHYTTHVRPLETTDGTLSFDIQIESLTGETFEAIRGVDMRPIGGISACPPDWIIV